MMDADVRAFTEAAMDIRRWASAPTDESVLSSTSATSTSTRTDDLSEQRLGQAEGRGDHLRSADASRTAQDVASERKRDFLQASTTREEERRAEISLPEIRQDSLQLADGKWVADSQISKPLTNSQNSKPLTKPVGVGMAVSVKKGVATVVDVTPGGAGWASEQISRGDVVHFVDGEVVKDKTVDEIVKMVKGEEGSLVVLAIQKPGEKEQRWVTLERRHTAGIGITFEKKAGSVIVESIQPDGAAAKSERLKVNDKIVAVDNRVVESMSVRQVAGVICGPPDKTVSLTIQRDGRLLTDIVIERQITNLHKPAPRDGSPTSSSSEDSESSSSSSDSSDETRVAAGAAAASYRAVSHVHTNRRGESPQRKGRDLPVTGGGIYGGIDASTVAQRRNSFRELQQRMAQQGSESTSQSEDGTDGPSTWQRGGGSQGAREQHRVEALTKERKLLRPPSSDPTAPAPALAPSDFRTPAVLATLGTVATLDRANTGGRIETTLSSNIDYPAATPARTSSPRRATSPVLSRNLREPAAGILQARPTSPRRSPRRGSTTGPSVIRFAQQ